MDALKTSGFTANFVQDNHSRSAQAGTVRGLHFQTEPFAQDKLVRVAKGAIPDVAVDIRVGSPTRGIERLVSAEAAILSGKDRLHPNPGGSAALFPLRWLRSRGTRQ